MPTVTVERTYLRLERAPAELPDLPLPDGVTIDEAVPCTVPLYRRLYAEVGAAYHWRDRLEWSDAQLAEHLARRAVRVWVLRDGEGEGGFFELVRDEEGAVEIAYFGLMPSRQGRGLGRTLLQRAIAEAYRWGASNVWLHTCTLDSPQALPNYRARGFVPFRQERYQTTLPAS